MWPVRTRWAHPRTVAMRPLTRRLDLFPVLEDLPERLWDMLLNRCPNLEDLIISCPSASPRLFNFQRITAARWPKLRSLTLGCIGYQIDFAISPTIDCTFAPFLDAHPTVETIGFQWNYSRWWSPEALPMDLPQAAVPRLKNFSGLYQQLGEFPNPAGIETLDLTFEPIPEIRVGLACDVLKNLTSLTMLDIWLYIPSNPGDLDYVFSTLLEACPKLSDLHLMCTSPFTSVSTVGASSNGASCSSNAIRNHSKCWLTNSLCSPT